MHSYIVIPAYNEGGNLPKILNKLLILKKTIPLTPIVVDDGSSDDTSEVARKFTKKLGLKLIVHKPNKGIPQTFYDGLEMASKLSKEGDAIFIIEGDDTSDTQLIPKMLESIKSGNDIIVASRYLKGGGYKNFPLHRTLGSNVVNIMLKLFFYQKNVTDYTIFFRAYSARVVKKAFEKYKSKLITTKSFAANLEILIKFGEFSRGNSEFPFVYDYGLKKGKSKMKLFKTLFEYKDLIIKKILGKN
ncbi:MAG: glycosyltransferase family 2 protein [Candidatus Pacearchaeota archaeon]